MVELPATRGVEQLAGRFSRSRVRSGRNPVGAVWRRRLERLGSQVVEQATPSDQRSGRATGVLPLPWHLICWTDRTGYDRLVQCGATPPNRPSPLPIDRLGLVSHVRRCGLVAPSAPVGRPGNPYTPQPMYAATPRRRHPSGYAGRVLRTRTDTEKARSRGSGGIIGTRMGVTFDDVRDAQRERPPPPHPAHAPRLPATRSHPAPSPTTLGRAETGRRRPLAEEVDEDPRPPHGRASPSRPRSVRNSPSSGPSSVKLSASPQGRAEPQLRLHATSPVPRSIRRHRANNSDVPPSQRAVVPASGPGVSWSADYGSPSR